MPKLPFRKPAPAAAPLVLPGHGPDERRRPPLIVLTPLASGVTSFQVNEFADSASARRFVQRVFDAGLGLPRGLTAFWALQNPPPEMRDSLEPVVLVSSPDRAAIACPYFFTDAAAGQSYAWTKLCNGIPAGSISIYVALIVEVAVDRQGVVSLSPAYPPAPPKSARHPLAGDELGTGGDTPDETARRHGVPAPDSLPRRA
ncbi:MAG TPA: hypothetical protein VMT90_01600 [Dehalococcoidia bacterium]|nr:hypothetical protein [Dehalococcoidia bacterium]